MIEQYVYDKVTADPTLQGLLSAGGGSYHVYPGVVPRDIEFEQGITFTLITTVDSYPTVKASNIQFNIFAKSHMKAVEIATALADLFNEDHNQTGGGVAVVFSIRTSESDIGFNFDDGFYQREATYSFKVR